jgi:hypothetical protein
MSNPSPIQARAPSGSEQGAAIRQSASFSAHLKNLEQKIPLRARYENFIGGKWVAPVKGGYFDNVSPTRGASFSLEAPLNMRFLIRSSMCAVS